MTGYLEMPEKTADTIVDGCRRISATSTSAAFSSSRIAFGTSSRAASTSTVGRGMSHQARGRLRMRGLRRARYAMGRTRRGRRPDPSERAPRRRLIAHVKTLIGSVKAQLVHVVRGAPQRSRQGASPGGARGGSAVAIRGDCRDARMTGVYVVGARSRNSRCRRRRPLSLRPPMPCDEPGRLPRFRALPDGLRRAERRRGDRHHGVLRSGAYLLNAVELLPDEPAWVERREPPAGP